jgi:hypothetical protein
MDWTTADSKLTTLSLEDRGRFLALLAFYLCQSARASYAQTARDDSTLTPFRAYNEMLTLVGSQLAGTLGVVGMGRPDSDFLDALQHWANHGGCRNAAEWALMKAYESLRTVGDP